MFLYYSVSYCIMLYYVILSDSRLCSSAEPRSLAMARGSTTKNTTTTTTTNNNNHHNSNSTSSNNDNSTTTTNNNISNISGGGQRPMSESDASSYAEASHEIRYVMCIRLLYI